MTVGEVLRWVALILAALLLTRVTGREFAVVVTLLTCVLVLAGAAEFLEPVVEFLRELRRLADLNGQAMGILLKAAGIGLISQLAALLCADAGEGALGKAVELGASAAILWLSLPLLEEILAVVQGLLAES